MSMWRDPHYVYQIAERCPLHSFDSHGELRSTGAACVRILGPHRSGASRGDMLLGLGRDLEGFFPSVRQGWQVIHGKRHCKRRYIFRCLRR